MWGVRDEGRLQILQQRSAAKSDVSVVLAKCAMSMWGQPRTSSAQEAVTTLEHSYPCLEQDVSLGTMACCHAVPQGGQCLLVSSFK